MKFFDLFGNKFVTLLNNQEKNPMKYIIAICTKY